MQIEHAVRTSGAAGLPTGQPELGDSCQFVLAFGSGQVFTDPSWFHDVKSAHPRTRVVGCSTAGEISRTNIHDESLVTTAVACHRSSRVECAMCDISDPAHSCRVGKSLAEMLPPEGLRHVLVFSHVTPVSPAAAHARIGGIAGFIKDALLQARP